LPAERGAASAAPRSCAGRQDILTDPTLRESVFVCGSSSLAVASLALCSIESHCSRVMRKVCAWQSSTLPNVPISRSTHSMNSRSGWLAVAHVNERVVVATPPYPVPGMVSVADGWRYNIRPKHLSEPPLGRLAGSPKASFEVLEAAPARKL
jgi:hypothetical protein